METSATTLDHEATTASPLDVDDKAEETAAASSSDRRRGSRVLLELNAIAHTLDSVNEVLEDILTLTAPPPPPSPSKRQEEAMSPSSPDAAGEGGEGHRGDPENSTGREMGAGTNAVARCTEGSGNERSVAVKQHRLLVELRMWEGLLGAQGDDDP